MVLDGQYVKQIYANFSKKLEEVRKVLSRPMTYSEKILYTHLYQKYIKDFARAQDYVLFNPDRVAMQDATAQMALLQFMCASKESTSVPTTVHCDHLIQAELGALQDLQNAQHTSHEVFDFLQSVSAKYGIGFWKPGAGIIHQVVLENYAFPGGMMIGTDSHTPNAGGLGMIAIGVGGADAVDVMAGMPWELKMPKLIGVSLKGRLSAWTSAKDIILKLAGILSVKGGTGAIIEYFGEGAQNISCTGKATICNMGAEIGATTSIFAYDESMRAYLCATGRKELALALEPIAHELKADLQVLQNPQNYYDQLIEIDLDELSPHINGPYSPDRAHEIKNMKQVVQEKQYPNDIRVALIGSCTNSSYEDMQRACSIAKQALDNGMKCKIPLTITPGSELIYETMKRDGYLELLTKIGGTVLANACGPCIGQWKRHDVKTGEKNTIVTSFNRNFSGRNDANPGTHAFVTSPEMVIAYALSGKLDFNPQTDSLQSAKGPVMLKPPKGDPLPAQGFANPENYGFIPPEQQKDLQVQINPNSQRLQLLEPFEAWNGQDFQNLAILVKAQGKCTTDHISPAGKWLRFRGHLDHISDNMFCGAVNAFRDDIGEGKNPLTGEMESFSQVARALKKKNIGWIAIGDENYGEGSSREHAAMEPRYLGAKVVLVKSFARIHETNLKKQGILALTFVDPNDYDKLQEDDRIDVIDLAKLAPGQTVKLIIHHSDGSNERIEAKHSFNDTQLSWFRAGSALNTIRGKTS